MNPKRLDLSVVIVSYNNRHLLADCIDAVMGSTGNYLYEIVLVDNGSTDDTSSFVQKEYPDVKLITLKENIGFAGANNVGFAQARGRYWVILNTDAIVLENGLAKAVALMDTNPNVGLGGARLIGRDGAGQPSALLFPSLTNNILFMTGLAYRFPKSRFFGRAQRSWADTTEIADVDWVPGAFSIIRSELMKEIGGFDLRFFFYYEEVDLCRRVKQAGYSVRYWPQVQVIHIGGEPRTSDENRVDETLLLWRMHSEFLYYNKHHGRLGAWISFLFGCGWHVFRALKNRGFERQRSLEIIKAKKRAWRETRGGKVPAHVIEGVKW